jgi:hypothetical protein
LVFIVVLDHFFGTCSIFVQKPPKFHGNNNDLSPKSHFGVFFMREKPWFPQKH